ncbi:hypothetical protein [Micromonospora thermarum]|uniref:Uncharacterized protein n=1 Tax=Micromonospora thermarum TaxID=2720024 RepID=A0ABX0Z7B5_9ACTN|nr:hypothetical protein [Micromonospora thermarum]NJP33722.1 hypothetical protein [Micromonospora thermarum]
MTVVIPRQRRAAAGLAAVLAGGRPARLPVDDDPLGLLHSRTDGDEDGPPMVEAPPAGVHMYPVGSRPRVAVAVAAAAAQESPAAPTGRAAVKRWDRLSGLARRLRAVLVALGAAAVAGSVTVLVVVAYVDAESAYLDVRWDPGEALVMALAAVWLTQGLLALRRRTRRPPARPGRHSHAPRHARPRKRWFR